MTTVPWKTLALLCLALPATPALAQTSGNAVASHDAWSVFVVGEPKECYIVSQPTGSAARIEGRPVDVNRGEIRLYVRFSPSENVRNEVSFRPGYPLREGEPVTAEFGSQTFQLDPGSGDANGWAWPAADDDVRIVAAMRAGSTATITGISARGTTTSDTFSLAGFTAAVNAADDLCR